MAGTRQRRTASQEIEALQAEVKRLHAALGESEIKRDEAESLALANSQAGAFVGSTGEHPTGKTVSVSVCINPGERNEKKQVFKTVELPTYFYTIDLPAGTASASTIGSGSMLTTNGIEYYNGNDGAGCLRGLHHPFQLRAAQQVSFLGGIFRRLLPFGFGI